MDDNFPLHGSLGHLCDYQDLPDPARALKKIREEISRLLPGCTISGNINFSAASEYDFFSEPPLELEQARSFEEAITGWAEQRNYDFCPCYLQIHIRNLAQSQESQ